MKTLVILILPLAALACIAGCDGSTLPGGLESLVIDQTATQAEDEGLLFMREEEKLAHDVYLYFDGLHDLPIFSSIADS
jgi:hypothetical protein